MLHLSCFIVAAVSLVQLTTQLPIDSSPYADNIEVTIHAHRDEKGRYVAEWALKDSSDALPENAKLDVKTFVSESQGRKTLIFQGTYSVPHSSVSKSTPLIVQKASKVPPSPPKGYEYFPGVGYYKFFPEGTKSFSNAMETCSKDGAYLAILNSDAEMEVLRSIYARYPIVYEYAYLGYYDQTRDGNYFTIFGDPLSKTGYARWDNGEPNRYNGNEHCGTMKRNGGLNDFACQANHNVPYFCEYDPSMQQQ